MNILGMEEEQDSKKNNMDESKRKLRTYMVVCVGALVVTILLLVYFIYLDSLALKVYIDSNKVANISTLVVQDENAQKTYISIEELAKLLGYTYYRGEYNSYTEDENSCYIKSTGVVSENDTNSGPQPEEYTSFTAQSNKMLKVLNVIDSTGSKKAYSKIYEIFSINDPVQLIEGKLYIPIEEVGIAFNIAVSYKDNRIRIQSLKTLVNGAQTIAAKAGYTAIESSYRNQRALASGMIIAQKDGLYGVLDFDGKDIIGSKYASIQYIQNTQDFIVKSEEQYVGLLSSTGETILKPDTYDDISVLDENEKLYVVKKSTSYGVINSKGEIIIHPEYTKIGLSDSEEFSTDTSINTKLFFGNAIPVKTKDLKWKIFSYSKRTLVKNEFDNFGYQTAEGNTKEESVLLIPASAIGVDAIVVYGTIAGVPGYGLVDQNGEFIIPCVCSKIYSTTTNGVKQYFIEYANTINDAKGFVEVNGTINREQNNIQEDVGTQNDTQIVTNDNSVESNIQDDDNSLTQMLNNQNNNQENEQPPVEQQQTEEDIIEPNMREQSVVEQNEQEQPIE